MKRCFPIFWEGIALYEIEDDTHLQILMVNDRYYRITGCNAVDLQERSRLITRQIHPEDMPLVWDISIRHRKRDPWGQVEPFGGTV